MKKRFVVILGDNATAGQHQVFLLHLKATQPFLGWWHRVANTWLVVDLNGSTTAVELRDAAMQCFPSVHCIVLEFSAGGESTWAGFGPKTGTNDWFTWIKENWQQ